MMEPLALGTPHHPEPASTSFPLPLPTTQFSPSRLPTLLVLNMVLFSTLASSPPIFRARTRSGRLRSTLLSRLMHARRSRPPPLTSRTRSCSSVVAPVPSPRRLPTPPFTVLSTSSSTTTCPASLLSASRVLPVDLSSLRRVSSSVPLLRLARSPLCRSPRLVVTMSSRTRLAVLLRHSPRTARPSTCTSSLLLPPRVVAFCVSFVLYI
jgi:hypothetical protein